MNEEKFTLKKVRYATKAALNFPKAELTIECAEFLLATVDRMAQALKYYQGDFNGREGTKWNEDGLFFMETKFGTHESADGPLQATLALIGYDKP